MIRNSRNSEELQPREMPTEEADEGSMTKRQMRMITIMLLVWSALYLTVMIHARNQRLSIDAAAFCNLDDRRVSRIGGTLWQSTGR